MKILLIIGLVVVIGVGFFLYQANNFIESENVDDTTGSQVEELSDSQTEVFPVPDTSDIESETDTTVPEIHESPEPVTNSQFSVGQTITVMGEQSSDGSISATMIMLGEPSQMGNRSMNGGSRPEGFDPSQFSGGTGESRPQMSGERVSGEVVSVSTNSVIIATDSGTVLVTYTDSTNVISF